MPIIEVKNLVKKFDDITAVDGVSFSVEKGEKFAFLGPNGAGKTTTIKIFTTLLLPDSGQIRINGYDPVTSPDEVRRSFGIIFQDPSLDDELTTFENLEFHGVLYGVPKKTRRGRIDDMLALVELENRRNDLVKEFSGGMKRRLEIARGLLHHPEIIFLDEPTLGLDPQTRNHMWNYISDMNKKEGVTVFFSTHYMEEAEKMSDRIAIIDTGRIVAGGNAAELKEKTQTSSLEDAFLALTGKNIREESAKKIDNLRTMKRVWKR
jgi:ABC-2 type transport system ATP-binding protein